MGLSPIADLVRALGLPVLEQPERVLLHGHQFHVGGIGLGCAVADVGLRRYLAGPLDRRLELELVLLVPLDPGLVALVFPASLYGKP